MGFPLDRHAFNPALPTVLHVDLNSCFATIEQQANPLYRGKPLVVAAYPTPMGCVVAPSIEAKRYGCQTGMRVAECQKLCPRLIVLPPDPPKYRYVHLAIRRLLSRYTDRVVPRSIDEFVLHLDRTPSLERGTVGVARELKRRLRREIGDYLTVSVGIGPNRFLAKTAAGLHKPDGLEVIDRRNFARVYRRLQLRDLTGIDVGHTIRLNSVAVYSVLDFYQASAGVLTAGFHSSIGFDWYARLRGWEVDAMPFGRKSFGHCYSLPRPLEREDELTPILAKLVEKMGARLRRAGYRAKGVELAVLYADGRVWHRAATGKQELFDGRDLYRRAYRLLVSAPPGAIRQLSVCCFRLADASVIQLDLFGEGQRQRDKVAAVDALNARFGPFTVRPATMLGSGEHVQDRISFGSVKELEEYLFHGEGEAAAVDGITDRTYDLP